MQYLLLIYSNEATEAAMSEAERGEVYQRYMTFTQEIVSAGQFKAGDALQPTSTATTVRVKGGQTMTTDGPFAETKEQLGGYYLVEASDLDEAVSIAARIPSAEHGCVEVRPIMSFD
ncbi:MAG: YciI family protein [Gammaproteobacteria bacterium]|nr:YciI family protein [Gammaproteobacteria bacterium]